VDAPSPAGTFADSAGSSAPRPAEAVDLLRVAGPSIGKRLAPVLAGAVAALGVALSLRRARQRRAALRAAALRRRRGRARLRRR
jgi:hypothetical protein